MAPPRKFVFQLVSISSFDCQVNDKSISGIFRDKVVYISIKTDYKCVCLCFLYYLLYYEHLHIRYAPHIKYILCKLSFRLPTVNKPFTTKKWVVCDRTKSWSTFQKKKKHKAWPWDNLMEKCRLWMQTLSRHLLICVVRLSTYPRDLDTGN